jgi:hypothetical protein
MAKLSSTSVKLDKGIGLAYIRGRIAEVVDVKVSWKEGTLPLESSTVRLYIGIGEE